VTGSKFSLLAVGLCLLASVFLFGCTQTNESSAVGVAKSNDTQSIIPEGRTGLNAMTRTLKLIGNVTSIEWISPTLPDSTVFNNTWNDTYGLYYNVSFTNTSAIDVCLINVNGTNYSMTLGKQYAYYSYPAASYGNYTASVYCNTTSGTGNASIERSVYAEFCRELTANYSMVGNASTSGTCFNVTAANVTLSCQGNKISWSAVALGRGIEAWNAENVSIENCIVQEAMWHNWDYGIYFENSNFGSVNNSTVNLFGVNGIATGIYLSRSQNVTLYNNTIFSPCAWEDVTAIYVNKSNYTQIVKNTILGRSTLSIPAGIVFSESSYGTIYKNFLDIADAAQYAAIFGDSNSVHNNVSFNIIPDGRISTYGDYTIISDNELPNCGYESWYGNGGCLSLFSSYNNVYNNDLGDPAGAIAVAMYINGSHNVIRNETLNRTGFEGVGVYIGGGGNNSFYDSIIGGIVTDINVSTITSEEQNFISCAFNKSKVLIDANGAINVSWYVDVHTFTDAGADLAGAYVSIASVNGTSLLNATSNATGWLATQTILEYMQNATGVYNATPHYFNASKTGYATNNTASIISEDHRFNSVNRVLSRGLS